MHYVYVIKNKYGKLYIGYTKDLKRRFSEHARDDKTFVLVYYEAYQLEDNARHRERKLKYYGSAWRGLKKRII